MIFKILLAFGLAGSVWINLFGNDRDTVQEPDRRLISPDYFKLQFAGGTGLLSAGIGYSFMHERTSITYLYGFVPGFLSTHALHSFSVQLSARTFKIDVNDKIIIYPFNPGAFFHYTIGNRFWLKLPSHYPDNYYWWSPGRSLGFYADFEVKTKYLNWGKSSALYARIGSRPLYIVSKRNNSSMPLMEIFEYGFGFVIYR